jgi:2-oxoglutarate ferredoxin oxidoreductase subunit alpha
MKGNEAIAEAAIVAGCRQYYGYPITPQNELAAYMSNRMPKVGGVFLQAESEIGAIHMVIGAAAAGKRAMTTSSSPGISLKAEGISYLAGCDLPAVLVNVQRGGPGLGTIQPSQADYTQATKGMAHGDFRMYVLAPNSIQEMADHTILAFDIADKYRVTSMILTDGVLGQMMEPVEMKTPGSSNLPSKDWAITGHRNKRAAHYNSSLYLMPEDLEKVIHERFARYAEITAKETLCERYMLDDADIVVTAYGATSRVAKNAVLAAREQGIKAGMLRPVTVWPFPNKEMLTAAKTAKAFVCAEMSMGQMIDDVRLAIECSRPVSFCGRSGGAIPGVDMITEAIVKAAKEVS